MIPTKTPKESMDKTLEYMAQYESKHWKKRVARKQ
jgi:hypothetical protein